MMILIHHDKNKSTRSSTPGILGRTSVVIALGGVRSAKLK
jgi:hypothetical protein